MRGPTWPNTREEKSSMVDSTAIHLDPPDVRGWGRQTEAFYPGTTVSGSVTVQVHSAVRCQRIVVFLSGEGRVKWKKPAWFCACVCCPSPGQNWCSYEEKTSEKYVQLQTVVWTSEHSSDGKLNAGVHRLPFQFTLPDGLPPSVAADYGGIEYTVKAVVKTGALRNLFGRTTNTTARCYQ